MTSHLLPLQALSTQVLMEKYAKDGESSIEAVIQAIHAEVKGDYGWPRVWEELLARGIRVGKDRVQRLMHTNGIKARSKKKLIVTTDSKHDLPIAGNLSACDFTPVAPDRVRSSDITYIVNDEGWLYLAAVIDLFSRQVVGWSMQPHMQGPATAIVPIPRPEVSEANMQSPRYSLREKLLAAKALDDVWA